MAVDAGPRIAPPSYLYGEDLLNVIKISAANGDIRDPDGRDRGANLRRCRTAAASQTKADLTSWSICEPRTSPPTLHAGTTGLRGARPGAGSGRGRVRQHRQLPPRTPRRRQEHGMDPGYRGGDARAAGVAASLSGAARREYRPCAPEAGGGGRWSTPDWRGK